MKVFFASDHAGFELKNTLLSFVKDELGFEIEDLGAYDYNETDDYPDFVSKIDGLVNTNPRHKGIILGGSGQGEAIVANRIKGIRAVVYYGGNEDIITLSREHNDANVLSLAARFINEEEAKSAVQLWLSTEFKAEERHQRRIQKIDKM